MMSIFLLTEPAIPHLEQIKDTLSGYYQLHEVSSKDALLEQLSNFQQAVVIFHSTGEKVSLLSNQFKQALASVSCIAVITDDETLGIPGYQFDCDFLVGESTPFEILSRVSSAVRQSELLSTIQDASQVDEVTQLFNRRYFQNRLNGEISLAKRHLSPLSCIIIGVNYYQVYLDSYGYDFVIKLLRHIALQMQNHIRQEDIIARIGDDEIALLLPRSSEKGAKILADRIVESINTTPFQVADEPEDVVVHAGIAGYPLPDASPADADAVIRFARHALHNARCDDEAVQLFSEIKPAL